MLCCRFQARALDDGHYTHVKQVKLDCVAKRLAELHPFVAIVDAYDEHVQLPCANTVAVSRTPRAGADGPLLEYLPQLLQFPVAQIRAFDAAASSIGGSLPLAFRVVQRPHVHDEESLSGLTTNGLLEPALKAVPKGLAGFNSDAFVISVSRKLEDVAEISLKGVVTATEGSPDHVIRLGPALKVSIGLSTSPAELAVGTLSSTSISQTLSATQVSALMRQAINSYHINADENLFDGFNKSLGGSMSLADFCEIMKGIIELVTTPFGACSDVADKFVKLFQEGGELHPPCELLTEEAVGARLFATLEQLAEDEVQSVLWVKIRGHDIEVGAGDMWLTWASGASVPSLAVSADICDESRLLSATIREPAQIKGVEFSSDQLAHWRVHSREGWSSDPYSAKSVYTGPKVSDAEFPFMAMYQDGQDPHVLPAGATEIEAQLPVGWNLAADISLAQFCSQNNGTQGTLSQLDELCKSERGQQLYSPLVRLCDTDIPTCVTQRATTLIQISKLTLGVIPYLMLDNLADRLVQSFARLAPLVFAQDKGEFKPNP